MGGRAAVHRRDRTRERLRQGPDHRNGAGKSQLIKASPGVISRYQSVTVVDTNGGRATLLGLRDVELRNDI